jgi:hypothetical protein
MNEDPLGLTVAEKLVLDRSADTDLTRRRVKFVVGSAVVLAAALIVVSPLARSWKLLLFFAVAYVLVTAWERVGFARTILAYKGLIQKLIKRVEELEGEFD